MSEPPAAARPQSRLERYTERRALRYERGMELSRHLFPRLRTRRARQILVAVLTGSLAALNASAVAAFWLWPAAFPFAASALVSAVALTLLRITTGNSGEAPAEALDERQLTERNAARALAFSLLLPTMIVVFGIGVALAVSAPEHVGREAVLALAFLVFSTTLTLSCLPDILLARQLPATDPDEEDWTDA